MPDGAPSAEARLERLIERLLAGAGTALRQGEFDLAREMAGDVIMVDPANDAAADLIKLADERQRSRHGERTVMTILFSDLVDSTPLADAEEPEIVRDVFSLYRDEAKRAIERFGGKIVNYLGDGVVATFGFPDLHEDDARRAVSAGLALLAGMESVAKRARADHGVDARVRVGIHTGLVVVADIGSGKSIEHDAIVGVTPNLAARLQAEARPGEVVISDVTQHIVESDFDLESLGSHSLKGIAREVELFRVVGTRHVSDRLAADRFLATPLVGREDVMRRLQQAWDSAVAGIGSPASLLLGQAGLGKSRVVAEYRRRVEASGGTLFYLGCLPYYTTSALWPVAESLKNYIGILHDSDQRGRVKAVSAILDAVGLERDPNLALLAPLVGVEAVPDHPAPELEPIALRQAVLNSVCALITARPDGAPRAVVVEDAHWADPSTLDLLGVLAAAKTPKTMLLVTSRVPLETSWSGDLDVIELSHLDTAEARDLIDELVGERALDAAGREAIAARADGIPLFIEELTRSALAAGGTIPVRLQELLAARLREPGVDTKVAQLAATVGVEFDASLLESLVADGTELDAALRSLQDAEIIDKLHERTGNRYRFRHALLRDAAYETQVMEARRDNHERIAGVLGAGGGDAAVIARHLDLAGSVVEAIGQYGVAVQAAQAAGAQAEAIQLATRSLELIAELPEGPERNFAELGMLMLRGLSSSSISGYAAPEVGADFRRANQLSDLLGTAPDVMPAAFAIWSFALVSGDVPTAQLLAARLQQRVEDGSGAWFAPEVATARGYQSLYEGDLAASRAAFAEAEAGFASRPEEAKVSEYWPLPNDPIAVNNVGLAVVASLMGDLAEGERYAAAAVVRAEEVPFPRGPFSVAFVKVYLAWLASALGDLVESQRFGEETTEIGDRYGYAYWSALGSIYHRVTTPDVAAFEQSMAMLRAIGHEAFRASYLAYLAQLRWDEGDAAAALDAVNEGLLEIQKSGELLHEPDLIRLRGELVAATGGDVAEELADLGRSLEMAREQGNALYGLRAALGIAELDASVRPAGWRDSLQEEVDRFAASADFAALGTAREILRQA